MKLTAILLLAVTLILAFIMCYALTLLAVDYLQHPTPLSANNGAYSVGVVWGGCKLDWGWYDEARRVGETGSVRVC